MREVSGTAHRLPSGPLHDAAEVARAGIPTVMMFVQSLRGISHNKIEDSKKSTWKWRCRRSIAWPPKPRAGF